MKWLFGKPNFEVIATSSKDILLTPPEVLEPRRGQFGVAHRVRVCLQRPRIVPLVGERVSACVPEHVRVGFEPQLRFGTCTLDRAGKASSVE
jgi:hypothetical protein